MARGVLREGGARPGHLRYTSRPVHQPRLITSSAQIIPTKIFQGLSFLGVSFLGRNSTPQKQELDQGLGKTMTGGKHRL